MMKRKMIHKLMTKRDMNQQKPKVQPVKKLARNIKQVKISFLENMHENFEGDQNNYNICGDDVDLVREIEMRSSINVVNENDELVSGFDAYNSSGDNVYDIFDDEDKIITKDSIFWVNTNIII